MGPNRHPNEISILPSRDRSRKYKQTLAKRSRSPRPGLRAHVHAVRIPFELLRLIRRMVGLAMFPGDVADEIRERCAGRREVPVFLTEFLDLRCRKAIAPNRADERAPPGVPNGGAGTVSEA
jgi:hypothetical protein